VSLRDRFLHQYTEVSEEQAERLQNLENTWYPVEVFPPHDGDVPPTIENFVRGILELAAPRFGLKNTSPVTAFEIRRSTPDTLQLQYVAPTKRLERKLRTQLAEEVPGVSFDTGVNGLPVIPGESVGGGILTTGRQDWFPLATEFSSPPVNALAALLHRHAMQDTRFVIQVLFKPIAGRSLRNWRWRRQAYQHRNYLKKEKTRLWGSLKPTRREKRQAHAVDDKTGNTRFWTCIRFLVVGAGENTLSRVKELAGGFNRFENPETGQYINTESVTPFREHLILDFCRAVAEREFAGWSQKFRTTTQELAGLVSIPDRKQSNIQHAQP